MIPLLLVGLASSALAREPMPGLLDDQSVYKWSAPTLDRGEWVAGLGVVAHGVTEETTIATEASSVILGFYNARLRTRLMQPERAHVSLDAGLGVVTPIALARLAVPEWPSRPPLVIFDAGVPITWDLRPGAFLTIRPWGSVALGRVREGDGRGVELLGRAGLSGAGASGFFEIHLTRNIGLVVGQDLGADAHGGPARLVGRTTGGVLFGIGKFRANAGLGVLTAVPLTVRGAPVFRPVPTFDLWGRW